MIDPRAVTKFDRTPEELEEFLLFSIVVAGKGAFQQAQKLNQFCNAIPQLGYGPFKLIRTMCLNATLDAHLRSVKMGQYERIGNAFRGVAHFLAFDEDVSHSPLYNISVRQLETIKGIGMKTARFFAMHTRPNVEFACLDTHILKWLSGLGYADVPKATPRGDVYLRLEQIFLQHARLLGKSPATLDLEIWNSQHPQIVSQTP